MWWTCSGSSQYSSLLAEYFKPEARPTPQREGGKGHTRLFKEMQLFRCKLDMGTEQTKTKVCTHIPLFQSDPKILKKFQNYLEELVTIS